MRAEFKIETTRPDTVHGIAGFLGSEYPDGEISDERFLKWEYLDNPFGKVVVTMATGTDGNAASQYALIPIEVLVKGKVFGASLSLNTLTAAAFRGKGLFSQTAKATFEYCSGAGIHFTVGVPNRNSYPGFINKLGFKHIGNLIFCLKPLRPAGIIRSLLSRGSAKKGSGINLTIDDEVLALNSVSGFDPVADRIMYEHFWELWRKDKPIALNRPAAFLGWRYFENPLRKYDVFKLIHKGEIKALLATRSLYVYGLRTCIVMDFLSLGEHYGHTLIRAIAGEAKRNDLDIMMGVTANRNAEFRQMIKSGFIKIPGVLLPQQLPLIIKVHRQFEHADMLFDPGSWHFMFGDYDIF